jgi:DNA-directed RNA polymerase specialized sigma24 family protein
MADDKTDGGGHGRFPTQDELLKVAARAASNGQPAEMLEALVASRFLDGLLRVLERRWGSRLPRSELENCVAVAVDSAYAAVAKGRQLDNLTGWLWKAACNRANSCWTDDYARRVEVEPDELDAPADDAADAEERRRLAEQRIAEAIKLARILLPRIGEGQLLDVMTIVINAVERGVQDLSPSVIAEALDLSVDAVRALPSRGFDRLAREARSEGIEFPDEVASGVRRKG